MSETPSDADRAFEFHMEEYKSLREELMAAQAERRIIDRLGAAAIIAIYSWLLTTGAGAARPFQAAAWALPALVSLIGLLLSIRITAGVRTAGTYLGLIEDRYADPELAGWHSTLTTIRWSGRPAQTRAEPRWHMENAVRLDRISKLSAWFWTGCLIASSAIAAAVIYALQTGALTLETPQ